MEYLLLEINRINLARHGCIFTGVCPTDFYLFSPVLKLSCQDHWVAFLFLLVNTDFDMPSCHTVNSRIHISHPVEVWKWSLSENTVPAEVLWRQSLSSKSVLAGQRPLVVAVHCRKDRHSAGIE